MRSLSMYSLLSLYVIGLWLARNASLEVSAFSSSRVTFGSRWHRCAKRNTADRYTLRPLFDTEKDDIETENASAGSAADDSSFEVDLEDDFPAWIDGLKHWPLRPQQSSTEATERVATDDSTTSSSPLDLKSIGGSFRTQDILSPLSRLIDMEALLNAGKRVVSLRSSASAGINITSLENLESLTGWDQWMGALGKGISDLTTTANGTALSKSAEGLLRQATARIDSLISEASEAVSPYTIQTLILRASEALQNKTVANNLVDVAQQMALDRGLDVSDAAQRAKETTAYAFDLVTVADAVLRKGYVAGDKPTETTRDFLKGTEVPPVVGSSALFSEFQTVSEITTFRPSLAKAAEMGALAGAIYEETVPRTRDLDHTIVAKGCTEDVVWMVTDHVADAAAFDDDKIVESGEPLLVRTITIRGFDASDDEVDRERVLNRICSAVPEKVTMDQSVFLHSGLNDIARSVYKDVKQYIDWMAPSHRLVLNGHSVGGSIANLILFMLVRERTAPWVRRRVQRVYTFGSPPIARLDKPNKVSYLDSLDQTDSCGILEAFQLPSTLVQSYVQPWDPIVRLFSSIDALYPLVGDLGEDGVTPFASGPPRTLRTVTKAIFEAWSGWPRFRDTFKGKALHHYYSVGTQYVLLPEPTRYLADRFVSVNVDVPPVSTVLRVSPRELHSLLTKGFPLDEFEISFIPQAIRGFIHHFYPAYGLPFVQYAKTVESKSKGLPTRQQREEAVNDAKEKSDPIVDLSRAAQWIPGYKDSASS